MKSYKWSSGHYLAVLVVIISDTKVSCQNLCPPIQIGECVQGMTSDVSYVNIISRTYCVNYFCDIVTDGGGWIVIQRRVNKDTFFNRTWMEYKHGFGTVCNDYWIGNENIYMLTNTGSYELRIDMMHRTTRYFASYREFYIDNEAEKYRLHISGYKGNTYDNFNLHNGMKFSTPDNDNDIASWNCAGQYNAGWWYRSCHNVNLNGHFALPNMYGQGVIWYTLTGHTDTLSAVEMKIRKKASTSNSFG